MTLRGARGPAYLWHSTAFSRHGMLKRRAGISGQRKVQGLFLQHTEQQATAPNGLRCRNPKNS